MPATKPKVLMFGWEFPPYNSGGLGIACLGLTQSLVKDGVEVTFVLPKKMDLNYDYMKFIYADESVKITAENFLYYQNILNPYLGARSNKSQMVFGHPLDKGLESFKEIARDLHFQKFDGDIYSEVLKYAILSEDIIRNETFDLIHCHDWLTIESGILAKKLTGKPLIFHIHATEIDRTGGNVNQLIYDIERKGMEICDKIVAVSNFTKNTIISHYGIPAEKIEVVHNGIDYYLEKNGEKDYEIIENVQKLKNLGKKIVLFTGRLTFQKGIEYFLQAAKIATKYDEKALFVIAGSGDMEHSLLELTASLGLSDKVIFPGFLRDEKLKALYNVADLFVMPSVNEPFGLVALEALTHETPLIISKSSGVAEILSHALSVDFWDVEEMAGLILAVLKHEKLQHTLSEFGKEEVKNISWDVASKKLIGVYSTG